jgi:twitching motility protein PilT
MVEAPATKLDPILRLAIELNATDIHVQVGLPPMFRVRGKLVAHQSEPLSAEQCEALVFSIMSQDQKKTFSERLDSDFSHGIISADDALESCFDPKEMARLLGRK